MAKTIENVEAKEQATTPIKKEPVYTLEKLRASCRKLFNVSSTTFTGATCKLPKKEYTIAEIKSVIEKWQKKEAK